MTCPNITTGFLAVLGIIGLLLILAGTNNDNDPEGGCHP